MPQTLLSPAIKLQLETAAIVFVSVFLTSLGANIQSLSAGVITGNLLWSVVATALGVAARAVYTSFVKSSLGGQIKAGAVK